MSSPNQITTESTAPAHLPRDPEAQSGNSSYDDEKVRVSDKDVAQQDVLLANANHENDDDEKKLRRKAIMRKARPFILGAIAFVILGWWVSSIVLPSSRHRWIVQSLWAWFFVIVIAFRFIPNTYVTRPVEAVWEPCVSKPFFKLPWAVRLTMGWLALLAIVFGSAFGFPLQDNSTYGDRAISVLGLFVFQFCFWACSNNRSIVPWPTVIVGLFIQQAIALFVLKSGAGFSIFSWIATLAADFLGCAQEGVSFFFDKETAEKHWFFASTLGAIIFFISFVQMMYYLGVMQWIIKSFAWLFFKIMNVSGAEAVVAAGSPFVGQGESACLVKPYVDLMTPSELHLTMTSGFATIAGSVLSAYINMGVPAENLVTSSVMSIPASIAISKLRYPENEVPVTLGSVVVDRGIVNEKDEPANALHAFSKGAVFGLIVAGQILTNVFTVLALVAAINGLLTWIGTGFHINNLTLQLIIGYIFYPVTFLLGVPRSEILTVSRLLATKLVANEFVAYATLKALRENGEISVRAYNIASYALCGFANLGSLGIQIGVLSAMAPSRGKTIARLAPSAMVCGFIATLQTAGIAGMLL